MEMGLYVPKSYAWEIAPVYSWMHTHVQTVIIFQLLYQPQKPSRWRCSRLSNPVLLSLLRTLPTFQAQWLARTPSNLLIIQNYIFHLNHCIFHLNHYILLFDGILPLTGTIRCYYSLQFSHYLQIYLLGAMYNLFTFRFTLWAKTVGSFCFPHVSMNPIIRLYNHT